MAVMTLSCLLDALQVFSEGERERERARVGSPSPAAVVWMLSPLLVSGVTWGKLSCFPVPPFPHLEWGRREKIISNVGTIGTP